MLEVVRLNRTRGDRKEENEVRKEPIQPAHAVDGADQLTML